MQIDMKSLAAAAINAHENRPVTVDSKDLLVAISATMVLNKLFKGSDEFADGILNGAIEGLKKSIERSSS